MAQVVLSAEQKAAVEAISAWLNESGTPLFKLGGLAGTGKTTILSELNRRSGEVVKGSIAFMAYTGKACAVLRSKGIDANTIHSTIYASWKDKDGNWKRRLKTYDELESKPALFCVDEASMLPAELFKDISKFNVPVLAVGDHGQLPPVSDNDINLMENPDYALETIHRQAKNNPIIRFAHMVRAAGATATLYPTNELQLKVQRLDAIESHAVWDPEALPQFIVSTNATRQWYNDFIRRSVLGRQGTSPKVNDRIIFLNNNIDRNIYNGLTAVITGIGKNDIIECLVDGETSPRAIPCHPNQWNALKTLTSNYRASDGAFAALADYAYAVTCHKAQGSEYKHAVVIEQPSSFWDSNRWLYTAATRARETLEVFSFRTSKE